VTEEVVVLEDKGVLRVLGLHTISQMLKVVRVSLVGLTPILQKLDLFTAIPADTDRTGEVLLQKLLLPLGNYNSKRNWTYNNSLTLF